jgi:hypothetical protein
MQIRKYAVAGILAVGITAGGITLGHGTPANAASTRISTVSQTETIVNSKCYQTIRVTTTNYHHSSTLGWVLYPAPKVTKTVSETCDK